MIALSICIPTYNRKKELGEALLSIKEQLDAEPGLLSQIEIVISDNASSDKTYEFVCHFKEENKEINIIYSRNEINTGADRNFLKVVELASGEYCWLMGSDDILLPGSLAHMLVEIEEGHSIYLLSRYNCKKKNMAIMNEEHYLKPQIQKDMVFSFKDENYIDLYFQFCNTIAGLFSYLTGIVVLKKYWDEVSVREEFIGLNFVHVAKLLQMINQNRNITLKYIYKPWVGNRCGNDSFKENELQRILLDLEAFWKFSYIFDSKLLQRDIQNIIRRTYAVIPLKVLFFTKAKDLERGFHTMKKLGFYEEELNFYRLLNRHKFVLLIFWAERRFGRLA